MIESLISALRLLLAAVGVIQVPDLAALGTIGAVTVVVVCVTLALIATLALALPHSGRASPAHPSRAIDLSSPLSQSDPDAAGHARPRAPGHAAAAA